LVINKSSVNVSEIVNGRCRRVCCGGASTKPMKRPIYTIFNVIYQVIICWVLVILNAFYNDLIIPESLVHSSERVWLKIFIALTEGVILILAAYASNRVALSNTDDKVTEKSIANRTSKVQLIITVCFTIAVILS
jgi:hypothetical protein